MGLMLWKEVKSWAKKNGYESCKNEDSYSWHKISDSTICGKESSVSKLSIAIFNDMTENRWIKHQQEYKKYHE